MNRTTPTSHAIKPHTITSSPAHITWTPGPLRHLLQALGDTPVTLTTHDGHAYVGTRLRGLHPRPLTDDSDENNLHLHYEMFPDATLHRDANISLDAIDAIIPNPTDDDTGGAIAHRARRTYRDEQYAAIETAQTVSPDMPGTQWGATTHYDHVRVVARRPSADGGETIDTYEVATPIETPGDPA